MRYLTAEEIQVTHREAVHEVLGSFVGKGVRDRFAIRVFNENHDAFFPERAGSRVLDCGTASGAFVEELAQAGYREIFGVDIGDYLRPGAKAVTREFAACDVSFQPLPWPEGWFNAVSAWCVLPHLENPFHCVREIARVLAPGGLFIFTVPHLGSKTSRNFFSEHGDFRSYRSSNNHISLFTPGVIQKTILRYFDLVRVTYHVRQKIFHTPLGRMRQLVYRLTGSYPGLRARLDYRWASQAIYVVRKNSPAP